MMIAWHIAKPIITVLFANISIVDTPALFSVGFDFSSYYCSMARAMANGPAPNPRASTHHTVCSYYRDPHP